MKNGKDGFWKWKEYSWANPDVDWKKAETITAGIDVGSVSSQCVIMADNAILAVSNARTGSSSPDSAVRVLEMALEATKGLTQGDIQYIVGTGYGRVNVPMANKTITEIACHARGANFIFGPSVRTVLDIGGQDCKAISCDEKGKVLAFVMNDKCAAGTGRGMEVIADILNVPIEKVGEISLKVEKEPTPVSSTCVVFARSEALMRIRLGWPVEKVLASYCLAMARRLHSLLEKVGIKPDIAITGGISKNRGVVERLEREIGLKSLKPKDTRYDPQAAGAIGAALFARALLKRKG